MSVSQQPPSVRGPYLKTTHTWTCENGHELVVKDDGHPQRPGIKTAVLTCWAKTKGEKCGECGAKVTYTVSTDGKAANAPRVAIE